MFIAGFLLEIDLSHSDLRGVKGGFAALLSPEVFQSSEGSQNFECKLNVKNGGF